MSAGIDKTLQEDLAEVEREVRLQIQTLDDAEAAVLAAKAALNETRALDLPPLVRGLIDARLGGDFTIAPPIVAEPIADAPDFAADAPTLETPVIETPIAETPIENAEAPTADAVETSGFAQEIDDDAPAPPADSERLS